MRQSFKHIDAFERSLIQQQVSIGRSYRSIAAALGRSASAISREVARNRADPDRYKAIGAGCAARGHRRRGLVKLREGSLLREHVITHIRKGWSPQQISGTLAGMGESKDGGKLTLEKDAPERRSIQAVGRIVAELVLGGLHHR